MRILVAAAFTVRSTYHSAKVKIPGKLFLGRDMILPINHIENFRYIRQRKQAQIEKYFIRKNSTIIDHNYIVGDRVMIRKYADFQYETSFKGPFEIFQTWTNRSVTL